MSALKLFHGLKSRGVAFDLEGEKIIVDAPLGVLTEEDRKALLEHKPSLLKLLANKARRDAEPGGGSDGRRFDARPSKYPGNISLYDPFEGRWHDWPRKDCEASIPSVVALAENKRKGTAK